MNKSHRNLIVFIISFFTFACALPGLSTPSEFPTPDSNFLSTVIAGTANAAAIQTAQAGSVAGTPLPVSTETAAPTATATATPRISAEGTSLVKQSDGSYIFTDYQGGYSVMVPSVWLAVRLNEEEYSKVWMLPEASNLNIQRLLTQWQASDPKIHRLFGLDTLPDHLNAGTPTDFIISWQRDNQSTIEQYLSDAKKLLPKSFLGSKISYSGMGNTSSQIPMGTIEANSKLTLTSGEGLSLYQKQAVFRAKNGLLVFTFTTVSSLKDTIAPSFNSMVDSIKMLP